MLDTISGVAAQADPFRKLWNLGYEPCSLLPLSAKVSPTSSYSTRAIDGHPKDPRGKAPAQKLSNGLWEGYNFVAYRADERDLERWARAGAGAGVKTGSGLIAIDADTMNPELAKTIQEKIEARFGLLPVRIGRAPKALYVLRTDDPDMQHAEIEFGPEGARERVEILGKGQQFAAFSHHPITRKPYHWPRAIVARDDLPVFPAADVLGFLESLRPLLPQAGPLRRGGHGAVVDQKTLRGAEEHVRRAVALLPNTSARFPTRESYLAVGYAIRAALSEENEPLARELFEDWCRRWTDGTNDPETVAADWRRMKGPYRRGAGWLIDQAGPAFWCEPVVDEPEYVSIFAPEEKPESVSWMGTPYRFPEPRAIPPREFLYGTHYLREFCSLTVAPTKVGKTSLTIVEALAMASGKPLLGIQPAGLLRVRLWNEDPLREMERRIAATMQVYGLTREDLGDRLFVDSARDQPLCVASQSKGGTIVHRPVVAAVRAAIEAQRLDVLAIDPTIKTHTVSENDNVAIDMVGQEWNGVASGARCAVEMVHHSRKLNGADISLDDARGASALRSYARSARVLARMSGDKTKQPWWAKGRAATFFRIADMESNVAIVMAKEDDWLQMLSVDLRNAVLNPDGTVKTKSDNIGVAKRFDAKAYEVEQLGEIGAGEAPTETGKDAEARAMAALGDADWRRDHRAKEWVGHTIGPFWGLDSYAPEGVDKIKLLIREWVKQGKLIEYTIREKKGRHNAPYIKRSPELADKMSGGGLFDD